MASPNLGVLLGKQAYNAQQVKEAEAAASQPSAYQFHLANQESISSLSNKLWTESENQSSGVSDFERWLMDNIWTQEAEREAAKDYNSWVEAQNKKAMDFEAEQAALNRLFQQTSADKAMRFESEEAEKLRKWQEVQNQKAMDFEADQAATSYQRAVKDLQAAGLNPIIALMKGGAGVASGVTSAGSAGNGSSASGSMAYGKSSTGAKANIAGSANAIEMVFSLLGNALTSAGKIASLFMKSGSVSTASKNLLKK